MTAPNITSELIRLTGQYSPEFNKRMTARSAWWKLIPKTEFPMGKGTTLKVATHSRVTPTTVNETWTDVAGTNGTGVGSCATSATQIEFGSTERTYNLQKTQRKTRWFCVDDFYFDMDPDAEIGNLENQLEDYTFHIWENRIRVETLRLSKYKVVSKAGGPIVSAYNTKQFTQQPTSKLTQGLLDKIYPRLIHEGATRNAIAYVNGAPVFPLIAEMEALDGLVRDNDDIREDVRYAKSEWNLAPLGVEKVYRGYMHICDPYGLRLDWSGGQFVIRDTFEEVAATNGKDYEVTAAWQNAEFGVAFVGGIPDIWSLAFRRPDVVPPGMRFDPSNHTGVFEFINNRDNDFNQRGRNGYFLAEYEAGSKPVHPEYGYAIIYKRCSNDVVNVTCSYTN